MLHKLFRSRKHAPAPIPITKGEEHEAALRIIHAGGRVELFYMAVPASRIIDKYPSFTLARPDVFRRPWDAVVRRDEILVPGQKYFVVPPGTVKKLRRRIKKPAIGIDSGLMIATITPPSKPAAQEEKSFSSSNPGLVPNRFGILIKSKSKSRARNRRVRFFGVDSNSTDLDLSSTTTAVSSGEQKKRDRQSDGEARKSSRNSVHQWQPSLISISEDQ